MSLRSSTPYNILAAWSALLSWSKLFVDFVAEEQAQLQKKYDTLKVEVDKRDQDIKRLQKNLKEAESTLVFWDLVFTRTIVTPCKAWRIEVVYSFCHWHAVWQENSMVTCSIIVWFSCVEVFVFQI